MPITRGPWYRLPCPASDSYVGKYTGNVYCRDCDTVVTLRKDGKPRAHKGPKMAKAIFTGESAADIAHLGRFIR